MQEKTGISPQALENAPSVPSHLQWYMEQFRVLQRDRRYEQGVLLPLGNDQIADYFKMFELYDFVDFHDNITRIDRIYTEESEKKSKEEKTVHERKAKTAPRKVKSR